jgi:small subunit ribosomal protein S6
MCLLDNREVRKGWQPLKDAVTGLFTKHGAKILSSRRWDERRLAYPIRGQHRGTYLLIYFSADTQVLAAIRRDLQFNESVLRSLLVDCAEVPQGAYEPEAAFDVNAIPADDSVAAPASAAAEPAAPATETQPAPAPVPETPAEA